jgi:hypothetical protein
MNEDYRKERLAANSLNCIKFKWNKLFYHEMLIVASFIILFPLRSISHVIFFSRLLLEKEDTAGRIGSAVLLDLILKMSFSAPLGHVHSAHCKGRLFRYIMSRSDTSLPP